MSENKFEGQVSSLFDDFEKGDFENLKHLEILEDYGMAGHGEDGRVIAYFQWDGGGRKLAKYQEDGSLFLIQDSEVQEDDGIESERDWYQVESEDHAAWINKNLNGNQLALHYEGPKVWTHENGIHFRINK